MKKVIDEDGDIVESIRCCIDHQEEYLTPLIWTFAFPGAEYWCPYCGHTHGMMGAGESMDATQDLYDRREAWTKHTKTDDYGYLHAKGVLVCISTEWEGKQIPYNDLPQEEKDKLEKVREEWSYRRKIEDILKHEKEEA